jgi:predicted metal-dependent enzyme (double-stranded beta helix superfamily)
VFDLDELLVGLQATREDPSPHLAAKEVLARHLARPQDVSEALAPRAGAIELLVHRPDITVIHATWAPGMHLMAHDHRMWAVIGIYQGAEDNQFYRRGSGGFLVESNGRRLEVGDVAVLGESTIHAVSNPARVVTGAIHVYGGDFVNRPRSQWGPGEPVERPYDLGSFRRAFHEANIAAGLDDA